MEPDWGIVISLFTAGVALLGAVAALWRQSTTGASQIAESYSNLVKALEERVNGLSEDVDILKAEMMRLTADAQQQSYQINRLRDTITILQEVVDGLRKGVSQLIKQLEALGQEPSFKLPQKRAEEE